MKICEELRQSILQSAIQGKLTEQLESDGTAEDLLKEICAEKKKLIAEGKIKKEKPLPPISEEEILFDIPENWTWCKLHDISYLIGSKKNKILAKEVIEIGKYPVVSQGKKLIDGYCNDENKLIRNVPVIMFGDHTRNVKYINFPFIIGADGTKFIKPITINAFYLYYCINYFAKIIKDRGYERHFSLLQAKAIPLPPLAEQQRIVKSIEILMSKLDELEKIENELDEIKNEFPENLRDSLLQAAIQGKLTDQRPEDGTAEDLLKEICAEKKRLIAEGKIKKEKPLPPISDEEKPFDIPDNWTWVRLADIFYKITDGTHSTPKYTKAGIPFLSVKDISSGKIDLTNTKFISQEEHSELYKRCNPEKGDLLITKVGTTGVPAIVDTDIEFSLFVSVALLKFFHAYANINYLYYTLKSPLIQEQAKENTRGVGNKNWVLDAVKNTIFPLPPLAEQERIVERLNELLPLCEKYI
ncbi:MAG: restriction endonuclease subunit S [Synergistaceae bacterium]|nr:restriction endonuclease subunit S [Synergistaceae bacterium]